MLPLLPSSARTLTGKTGVTEIYRRLELYHGIDPNLASKRLHEIKADAAYAADADLLFDMTGNVYDPDTLEWVGSLTMGGGKSNF
jgi:hypothetical protein